MPVFTQVPDVLHPELQAGGEVVSPAEARDHGARLAYSESA